MSGIMNNSNLMLVDPLEQFGVFNEKCFFLSEVYHDILIVGAMFFLLLAISSGYPGYRYTMPNVVLLRDLTISFISQLMKDNLNINVVFFFPVIYVTFFFLLLINLSGLVPYSATVTSSAALTFFISVMHFVGATLVGYTIHKDTLFRIFLPAGVPLYIAPFIVLIEIVSYAARVFSLAIRLFANMMSGHGLLKIIGTFVWGAFCHTSAPIPLYFFPVALVFIIAFLEMAIAFLQAYVFTVLVCIYLNDMVCLH
jgi:ATP synthase subunit 6